MQTWWVGGGFVCRSDLCRNGCCLAYADFTSLVSFDGFSNENFPETIVWGTNGELWGNPGKWRKSYCGNGFKMSNGWSPQDRGESEPALVRKPAEKKLIETAASLLLRRC